jgi:hypothetical protein
MFQLFVFLTLFQWSALSLDPAALPAPCDCPGVTNLQKTWQTATSVTYGWDPASGGVQYKVWYTRQEGGYSSGYFYTGSPSYQFTGLSAGHYTFYFQTLCEGETSGYIGAELIVN